MRYYVISDIHGNLEALHSVLEDISTQDTGEYLCIGDLVGYGADPQGVIRIVQSIAPKILIAGNHDWGMLDLLDLEYFNEYAKEAAIWTKSVLNKEEMDYLKSFRLVYEGEVFTLVHGSLDDPEKFYYIFNGDEAYFTMRLMKTPLCFVGHTHAAGIFYFYDGKMGYTQEAKIKIDYSKKYVINVGSIGQPRDRDPRASYAIYDDEVGAVEIRRVDYDIKTTQKKILDAGLPAWLASRLSQGR